MANNPRKLEVQRIRKLTLVEWVAEAIYHRPPALLTAEGALQYQAPYLQWAHAHAHLFDQLIRPNGLVISEFTTSNPAPDRQSSPAVEPDKQPNYSPALPGRLFPAALRKRVLLGSLGQYARNIFMGCRTTYREHHRADTSLQKTCWGQEPNTEITTERLLSAPNAT
jgi:hypothetical protein